jgi:hypothetical protein
MIIMQQSELEKKTKKEASMFKASGGENYLSSGDGSDINHKM